MYHGTIYSVPRYWAEVMGLVWGPAGCRRQKGVRDDVGVAAQEVYFMEIG